MTAARTPPTDAGTAGAAALGAAALGAATGTPGADAGPFLRVVKGHPAADELAAVVMALALVRERTARRGQADGPGAGTGWARRAASHRAPLARGPGAWRRSALPG